MRLALPLVLAGIGCAHADVRGRENLRLGPLREMRLMPVDVDPQITVDAGSDALTDAELVDVEQALAASLQASFQRLATDGVPVVRAGRARVDACKLRAGPNERFVVYLARCHVSVIIDGVVVVEATGEGLRRSATVFRRQGAPTRPAGPERDARVDVADSRAALVSALDAAARVLVDGPLSSGELPLLPRVQRASFARARLAAAASAREKIAALFDLRSAGVPADAALAVPHLAARTQALLRTVADIPVLEGDSVVTAAIDAIGELCDPSLTATIAAVPTRSDIAIKAKTRALARLRACALLTP